jgi:predicted AlkP superfamily phosphohydrolase/phosphomutase
MTELTKILFIGVDAGDKDLILKWAEAGLLPAFRALLRKGAWGITVNPPGFYVGAIWPSFYTGLSPAQHTRYCYRQLSPGTYETYPIRPSHAKGEPFWNGLSRADKKVAVIDVPKTFPSQILNGIHIVDWGTHDPDSDVLCTWPTSLVGEVLGRFGRDTIGDCNAFRQDATEFISFRDALLARVGKKAALSRYFLQQGRWDCFLTVFSESHCVGHQCWHLHDPSHPAYDPAVACAVGDPIKDVYIAIDQAVGGLIEQAGPETVVMILASHGMGPHYDGTFLLDLILQRLEGVNPPKSYPSVTQVMQQVWGKLPEGLRNLLRPLISIVPRPNVPSERNFLPVGTRKCFQIPNNDVHGAIRINLSGREPNGQIQPGQEYKEFVKSLSQDLLSFVNLDTGESLVRRVFETADFYQGKYMDHLPDLWVEWNRDAPITSVYSSKTGKIHALNKKCRTGDHKPDGLFFLLGPSIRPGPIGQSVSVMDFAPTISSLLGVEPSQFEGQSIIPV